MGILENKFNNEVQTHHSVIDGIRAVAIILVLLFHFELAGASRGFLGVDVFFVISGFLVGGLIIRDCDAGKFKLSDFYRRRIARILPALLAVSVATLATGWFLLLPSDFVRAAEQIRAALLLVANHHFLDRLDYFAPEKYDTYFLHSWSLSVEEQFYLIFPLIALAIAKARQFRTILITIMMAISLCLYILIQPVNSGLAFFIMPLRAWEMLVGVWLASRLSDQKALPFEGKQIAILCVVMMIAPAFAPASLNPELSLTLQAIAVIGTALLISGNLGKPNNMVARILSNRSLGTVGNISYSLYLIHWPVITLAKYWAIVPINTAMRVFLLVACFPLAWLCWRYIEQPIRRKANAPSTPISRVYAIAAIATTALVLACVFVIQTTGVPNRFSPDVHNYMKGAQDHSSPTFRYKCHSEEVSKPVALKDSCFFGSPGALPDTAIWADSFGVELSDALSQLMAREGRALVQLTSSACPPVQGLEEGGVIKGCIRRNDEVMNYLSDYGSVKTIVIDMNYMGLKNANADFPEIMHSALLETVRNLKKSGKEVIIVEPVSWPLYNVPAGLAKREAAGNFAIPAANDIDSHLKNIDKISRLLRDIGTKTGAKTVSPTAVLCGQQSCPYSENGKPLYYDQHHVSLSGVKKIAALIWKQMPSAEFEHKRPF